MTIAQPKTTKHLGRRIGSIRRLRGITENEFGVALGLTAQEVSMLEQLENLDVDRIREIASALGVTEQGLLDYNDDIAQYNTINFYENCGVNTSTVANYYHHTVNNSQYEKLTETLELILKKLDAKSS